MPVLLMAIAYPVAIALLFYFAFLRPVQQNQKRQREELASLRVGDEVLTTAGFIAVIKDIRVPEEHGPTEIILDLGGLEVRAVASAILQRLTPSPQADAAPENQRMPNPVAQGPSPEQPGDELSPLPRTGEGPGVRDPRHA